MLGLIWATDQGNSKMLTMTYEHETNEYSYWFNKGKAKDLLTIWMENLSHKNPVWKGLTSTQNPHFVNFGEGQSEIKYQKMYALHKKYQIGY